MCLRMLTICSIVVTVLGNRGYVKLKPRDPSPVGLFSTYDGNIIGGAILGAGMALSGACPGTLLGQVASGVASGFYTLAGTILGGIVYIGFVNPWVSRRLSSQPAKPDSRPKALDLHQKLGISRTTGIIGLQVAFGSVVAASMFGEPSSPELKRQAIVGGLLVGISQLVSTVSRGTLIGTSTTFEEIGKYFWWILDKSRGAAPTYNNLTFSAGLLSGAYVAVKALPSIVSAPPVSVSPLLAILGGFLIVIGSRVAGGCTSGHGISGISLLSISSLITIAMTFAGGAVVAPLVY